MILGSPQILGTLWVEVKWCHPRSLVTTIPGSLKPDSRDPETETGNPETEKKVHRIHDTLEKGLQMITDDASQPGGPLKGGRRIYVGVSRLQCFSNAPEVTFLIFVLD